MGASSTRRGVRWAALAGRHGRAGFAVRVAMKAALGRSAVEFSNYSKVGLHVRNSDAKVMAWHRTLNSS